MIALMIASRNKLKQTEQNLLEQIQESQRELKRVRGQLAHLDGFLKLEEGVSSKEVASSVRPSGVEICDMVETILLENGNTPIHYSELTEEVQKRGVIIGGIEPERTLLSNIGKDKRFHRPAKRGQYAIRVEHLAQLENKRMDSVDTEADSDKRSSSPNEGGYGEWGPPSEDFYPPSDVGEIPF
ncbi:MAG: hypothetical protein OXB89_02525 [Anaerolineaceae bacterium]|nr:hypothetical protein [Anaerolineaceae bacterium]